MGWIKGDFLQAGVGPGERGVRVAAGNILANSFVTMGATGTITQSVAGESDVAGVALVSEADAAGTQAWISGDNVAIQYSSEALVVVDADVVAGDYVKVGTLGRATPAMTSLNAGTEIESSVGVAFTNQPANDAIEVISNSISDTQQLTLWGTTNGGVVLVSETITLTGTTAVTTAKSDWGVLLGVEVPYGQKPAAGTITIREASGNAAITTLTAGQRRKGVVNVPGSDQRAFNKKVGVVADGATTKVIGIVGEDVAGAAQLNAAALTGATATSFAGAFGKVTKLLVGDVEVSRIATISTSL